MAPTPNTCPVCAHFDCGCCLAVQMFAAWSSSVSSNSVVLLLAEVMGSYFVSYVLLMRMNLPPKYRHVPHAPPTQRSHLANQPAATQARDYRGGGS